MTLSVIDRHVLESYESVIKIYNTVMRNAGLLGIHLDIIQDPTVQQIVHLLDVVVIPTLDRLLGYEHLSPESGIRIANIRQYALHLRCLQIAIADQSIEAFDAALVKLQAEAML